MIDERRNQFNQMQCGRVARALGKAKAPGRGVKQTPAPMKPVEEEEKSRNDGYR